MLLQGKTAIITGTNKGIGKAILEKFANEGANIYACARTETVEFVEMIDTLKHKTGVSIIPVYFDLRDQESMRRAVKEIHSHKKIIDILVNNAGIAGDTLFQMTSVAHVKNMLETNFFAPVEFTQYVIKLMKKSKSGSIINITSIAAEDNYKGMFSYSASKAALASMTKTLSRELGALNIRVNAIAPGFTETEMIKSSISSDGFLSDLITNSSLKRLGKPEEIANGVMFLASDLSSYITGQVLRIDGGISIG